MSAGCPLFVVRAPPFFLYVSQHFDGLAGRTVSLKWMSQEEDVIIKFSILQKLDLSFLDENFEISLR